MEKSVLAAWRRFVEREMARSTSRTGIADMQLLWMQDDVYICVKLLHANKDLTKELLLTLAGRFKQQWEQRFIGIVPVQSMLGLRLHAGVAYMGEANAATYESMLYDGMKKALIHGQSLFAVERSHQLRMFEQLTNRRQLHSVYQPIIALHDDTVYGYEALMRFPQNEWFAGPQQLFDFAAAEGMVYTLDRLARECAIESSNGLNAQQKLFINITAEIMEDPTFTPGRTLSLLKQCGLAPGNVVFEITERSSIDDFGKAKKTLDHYRNQGFQIAIDDAGAGYSSLQSIVELKPDFIKIDRSLIRGIHADPVKVHIVQTFTEFAAKLGSRIVAEGIETEDELRQIRGMGVHYGQGYLLGRPHADIPAAQ